MNRQTTHTAEGAAEEDERFAELIEAFAKVVAEKNDQKTEAFLQLHEDQAARLRRLLPTMQAMAVAGAAGDPQESCSAGMIHVEGLPDGRMLGDFRVLRELGRGGMGIVYEAQQVSMGRKVALKILPLAAVVDPRHVRRFKNEVQAAALLQHQNIVPVYSVGCEHGIHFYAMQYVEGHTRLRRSSRASACWRESTRRNGWVKVILRASWRR